MKRLNCSSIICVNCILFVKFESSAKCENVVNGGNGRHKSVQMMLRTFCCKDTLVNI